MKFLRHSNDPVILAVLSGATLQASLSALNTIVGIAVGLATLYYIARKTKKLDSEDGEEADEK